MDNFNENNFIYISNSSISFDRRNVDTNESELFRDLNYDEIVSLIINRFINNGSIGGVAYGIAIKEGIQRNVIEMIDGKRMIIDKELSISDLNNILNKYQEDRINTINNGSYNMIELIPGNIYSSKYQIVGDRLKIYLSRKLKNNEFEETEFYFLKDLIDELFYGEIVSIRGMEDKNMLTFYLGSDNSDLKIKLTNMANYNSLIYALISNHNIEVNENINRKLKKEGEN
ncbi:MAG: hypothetical protein IJ399_03515 [Bacilli bacterium]|nr:hypothetical protein [Bacilli bacterium]